MGAVAVTVGIIVFFVVGCTVDSLLEPAKGMGYLPGLLAGIWAAWPIFHRERITRYNFLHPVPQEYRLSIPQAFAKIRYLLAELSYNFGDKWQVVTADTQSRRIVAHLRYTDENIRFEPDMRGIIHTRKERVQRFLELEVQMKDTGQGSVIVQLDIYPKIEGPNFYACDAIVAGVCGAIDSSMGPGTAKGTLVDTKLPAPPLWLVTVSVLALNMFFADTGKLLAASEKRIQANDENHRKTNQAKANQRKHHEEEFEAWRKFKEEHHLT